MPEMPTPESLVTLPAPTFDAPTPTPTCPGAGLALDPTLIVAPLLTDNFDGGALPIWSFGAGWGMAPESQSQSSGGSLLVLTDSQSALAESSGDLGDQHVRVRVRLDAGGAGVELRRSAYGLYRVIWRADGTFAVSRSGEPLCTGAFAVDPASAWHDAAVWLVGGRLTVVMNGVTLARIDDPAPLPPGRFALVADSFTQAAFDDVTVSAVGYAPTMTATASVTPSAVPETTEDMIPISTATTSAILVRTPSAHDSTSSNLEYVITFDAGGAAYSTANCVLGVGRSGNGWSCTRSITPDIGTFDLYFSPECVVTYVSIDFKSEAHSWPHVAVQLHGDSVQWYRHVGYPAVSDWATTPGTPSIAIDPPDGPTYVTTFKLNTHFNPSGFGTMTVDNIVYRCVSPTPTPTLCPGDAGASSAPLCQLATQTPTPSPVIPPATATYAAALRLATDFPLPMDPSNLSAQPARLSNSEFVDRDGTAPLLCSRDVNPIGGNSAGYNLIAPANAEVMIIDETFGTPFVGFDYLAGAKFDNEGLGRFLAMRIRVSQLPDAIVTAIDARYPTQTPLDDNGWLYIGYAHLDSVASPLSTAFATPTQVQAGVTVSARQVVGTSGNSSDSIPPAPTLIPHLDVSVFYTSNQSLRPTSFGRGVNNEQLSDQARYFQGYIRLFTSTGATARIIDPLLLWPLLADTVPGNGDFANRLSQLLAQPC